MHVEWLLVRRTPGTQQRVDETGESIRLADDHVGVLGELRVVELPREQLRGAPDAAQRVFDLVGELPDHLPAGTVLDQQRVFAADLRAPRYVGKLDEQRRRTAVDRRHAAIDDAFVRLDLVRAEPQLVRVVIPRSTDPTEDVAQLGIVVQQPQQRFSVCAPLADPEYVFRSGIEARDKQVPVQQDHPGAEAVEDVLCLVGSRAIVAGALRACGPAPG